MLHLSRAAICSTLVTVPATISSSQRRPRAIDATSVARGSAEVEALVGSAVREHLGPEIGVPEIGAGEDELCLRKRERPIGDAPVQMQDAVIAWPAGFGNGFSGVTWHAG